jgi:hypothetical protein
MPNARKPDSWPTYSLHIMRAIKELRRELATARRADDKAEINARIETAKAAWHKRWLKRRKVC